MERFIKKGLSEFTMMPPEEITDIVKEALSKFEGKLEYGMPEASSTANNRLLPGHLVWRVEYSKPTGSTEYFTIAKKTDPSAPTVPSCTYVNDGDYPEKISEQVKQSLGFIPKKRLNYLKSRLYNEFTASGNMENVKNFLDNLFRNPLKIKGVVTAITEQEYNQGSEYLASLK